MKFLTLIFICLGAFRCAETVPFTSTASISDPSFRGEVKLERIRGPQKYRLSVSNSLTGKNDRIHTPYEVFQMELADVNHDGRTDICLGIIKPTPFDPVPKKRLFIFEIDRDYIRPLWLSSRLVRPLEAFIPVEDGKGNWKILSLEKQSKDLFCVHEYEWESFGMAYQRQLGSSLDYKAGRAMLEEHSAPVKIKPS